VFKWSLKTVFWRVSLSIGVVIEYIVAILNSEIRVEKHEFLSKEYILLLP
jgi:hypothetical protein